MEHEVSQNKTVEVDGFTYLIGHPQVEEAWDIGIELLKMIGGSAASMVGGAKDESSAASALSVAVNGLLSKVDGRTSMALIKRMFRYVEVQGVAGGDTRKFMLDDIGIKTHFRGRTGSVLRLAGEVVGFTHADFFDAIGEGVAELMKMVTAKMA